MVCTREEDTQSHRSMTLNTSKWMGMMRTTKKKERRNQRPKYACLPFTIFTANFSAPNHDKNMPYKE
jgi:hypothetical protein